MAATLFFINANNTLISMSTTRHYIQLFIFMSGAPNATPFLRFKNMPRLLEAMLLQFRSIESLLMVPKPGRDQQGGGSRLGCKPDQGAAAGAY